MFAPKLVYARTILVIGIASPLCAGQEEAAAGLGSQSAYFAATQRWPTDAARRPRPAIVASRGLAYLEFATALPRRAGYSGRIARSAGSQFAQSVG